MNWAGMAVDVSHCGDRTTLDAFEVSKRRCSSRIRTAAPWRRATPLQDRRGDHKDGRDRGVMGITGVRMFVRNEEPTTIEHYIDHIEHVARLTAIEHVGIGSDMDLRLRCDAA